MGAATIREMSRRTAIAIGVIASSTASTLVHAHAGHVTPTGISPEFHAHLTSSAMVPSGWLVAALTTVAVLACANVVMRKRRASRSR
jgi:membrane protease YdiL (CAAX protease family)